MIADQEDFMPMHPGEILKEEFMDEYGLTAYKLAQALQVPRNRIESLVRGERSITPDTALRLSRFFGTSERFWLNLQTGYDVRVTTQKIAGDLEKISPVIGL